MEPTPEERQQPEAHLIGPVQVLEDQQKWLPQRQEPHELRDALEELSMVTWTWIGFLSRAPQLGKEPRQFCPQERIQTFDRLVPCVESCCAKGVDPRSER